MVRTKRPGTSPYKLELQMKRSRNFVYPLMDHDKDFGKAINSSGVGKMSSPLKHEIQKGDFYIVDSTLLVVRWYSLLALYELPDFHCVVSKLYPKEARPSSKEPAASAWKWPSKTKLRWEDDF